MEQLVTLNETLMQSNNQLAQQSFLQNQDSNATIHKLQQDLAFYMNKANSLDHIMVSRTSITAADQQQ